LIALDASTLIAYLDRHDALHERAQAALVEHAGDRLCASVVTLAEILVEPVRRGAAGPVREALAALEVAPVELRAGDELALAELRARTGLKLPDCCVLMAARVEEARVLSFDERLLRAADLSAIRIAEHSAG
jgi:predicted nucleic acid-binding protein